MSGIRKLRPSYFFMTRSLEGRVLLETYKCVLYLLGKVDCPDDVKYFNKNVSTPLDLSTSLSLSLSLSLPLRMRHCGMAVQPLHPYS